MLPLRSEPYNTNNGLAFRVTYPNGMIQSNVFDVMDRIVGIEYHCTTGLVSSFSYAYNDAGMITNRTTEDGGQTTVVSYAYNSVDELVREYSSVTHATGVVNSLWEYSYDLAGNRMTGWGGGSSNAEPRSAQKRFFSENSIASPIAFIVISLLGARGV